MGHMKISGFVETIEDDVWTARLFIDGEEFEAAMDAPLPKQARPGSPFSIHQTKAGRIYLYWIDKPGITKRQRKRARTRARGWAAWLKETAA